jgi:gamma-glutamylputrescine oxidase
MALMRRRIDRHAIACDAAHAGVMRAWWTDDADAVRRFCDLAADAMGVAVEFVPRTRLREQLLSARYFDGAFAPDCFHLHPLNYALGIAAAAEAAGVRIYEDSPAIEIDLPSRRVRTAHGGVNAETLVIACGGYLDGLVPTLSRAIQPVATHVMATAPLGERLSAAMRGAFGVIDSRFDFDYYRPLADTRILFGAGITVLGEPHDLAARLLRKLLAIYPQLAGATVDVAWSGLMSYAAHQMPQLGEVSPGLWYAQAFGGTGLAATTLAGELIAAAIAEGDDRYRLLAPFGLTWAGGKLGSLAFEAAYRWYRLRDRFGR